MQRTIRLQLKPNDPESLALSQTIEQYTWSFNAVCRYGWEQNLSNGVELHKATYYEHRMETGLPVSAGLCRQGESGRSFEIGESPEKERKNGKLSRI